MLFRRFVLCVLIFGGAALCTRYARPHLGPFRFDAQRPPYALAFSSDGKEIVSVAERPSGDVDIHRWTLASGGRVDLLVRNPEPYGYGSLPDLPGSGLPLSADGQLAVFGGGLGTIFVCETRSGKLLHKLAHGSGWIGAGCSVLSPDGKLLVRLNGPDSSELAVLEISSGKTLGTIPGRNLFGVAFSADHQKIVVPDELAGIGVWSIHPFEKVGRVRLSSPFEELGATILSPDAKILVAACVHRSYYANGERKALFCWDTRTGTLIWQQTGLGMNFGPQFSLDGKKFAFADGATLHVCSPKTGIPLMTVRRPVDRNPGDGFHSFSGPLAFAPDGRTLATSGTDGFIRLWDVRTGMELTAR